MQAHMIKAGALSHQNISSANATRFADSMPNASIFQPQIKKILGRKIPLVVGGVTGPGTDVFAKILSEMGVPIIRDNTQTGDVGGGRMVFESRGADGRLRRNMGWLPLVTMMLLNTRSAVYEAHALPDDVLGIAMTQLKLLVSNYTLQRKQIVNASPKAASSDILYGFKAPECMLLVPLLQQLFGEWRYLHLVRDGRDVASSAGFRKLHLHKFYENAFHNEYGHSAQSESREEMAMWSDWNTELVRWLHSRNATTRPDFMVLRIEDFWDPRTRSKVLLQLARFVGSTMTTGEVCCLAKSIKDSRPKLRGKNFFGRAQSVAGPLKGTSDSLEGVGDTGLAIFGYEPVKPYVVTEMGSQDVCDTSVLTSC